MILFKYSNNYFVDFLYNRYHLLIIDYSFLNLVIQFNAKEKKSVPFTILNENSYISSPTCWQKLAILYRVVCFIPSDILLTIGDMPDLKTEKLHFLWLLIKGVNSFASLNYFIYA